jgi:uncharacterized membrane protein
MSTNDSLKQYNLITYILHLLGFFSGITPIIAVIMNYIKRDEMRGTWLESHCDWQIKTFWVSLIGYIVGAILMFVLIGFAVLVVVFIWHVYRLIQGVIHLNDNKPIA